MKLEEVLQTQRFRGEKHKAGLHILYTAWWLKTALSRELKTFGLTLEQYNVMRILKGKAPQAMCVKDIAGRMIEKSSNVPRIIDRLAVKKLVKRSVDPSDKRHTVIQLTASGKSLLEKSTRVINALSDNLMALSDQDAYQLNLLLDKLRENQPKEI